MKIRAETKYPFGKFAGVGKHVILYACNNLLIELVKNQQRKFTNGLIFPLLKRNVSRLLFLATAMSRQWTESGAARCLQTIPYCSQIHEHLPFESL
jgi:hypothetical protein